MRARRILPYVVGGLMGAASVAALVWEMPLVMVAVEVVNAVVSRWQER